MFIEAKHISSTALLSGCILFEPLQLPAIPIMSHWLVHGWVSSNLMAHHTLMMGRDLVPETLIFDQEIWLTTRKNVTNFSYCRSLKSYIF
jgi:hypothetical protein